MGAHKLTRWQKASALVPMAVLVGAWGAALGNSSLATASSGTSDSDIPSVPGTAFEQPASVQASPQGIDERAGEAGTVKTLSTNGIPASALSAYRRAETLLGKADESCNLPWNLVAAIGRVESNHGRINGNALDSDGIAQPGIYGIPLNGANGTAKISDTDNGTLDKNSVYDRAVGPMQFIPGTWKTVGVDSDNDGKKNPQSIDDAATSAGIYLCAGSDDLSKTGGAAAAVKRYNHSDSYVDLVLKISAAYAGGDFTQSPDGYSASPVLSSYQNDQTLTPQQRAEAAQAERKVTSKPKPRADGAGGSTGGGTTGGGSTSGGTGGGSTGGETGGGTGGSTGGGGTSGGTVGGTVQDLTDDTPLGTVTAPVTGLLGTLEATVQCLVKYPLKQPKDQFDACVYDLTH
ncbi:MAG: hypothetical protein JWP31_1566 [Aeromicrobium sp.]|nr:hypothetical protein [Aeromicrobium sp.]